MPLPALCVGAWVPSSWRPLRPEKRLRRARVPLSSPCPPPGAVILATSLSINRAACARQAVATTRLKERKPRWRPFQACKWNPRRPPPWEIPPGAVPPARRSRLSSLPSRLGGRGPGVRATSERVITAPYSAPRSRIHPAARPSHQPGCWVGARRGASPETRRTHHSRPQPLAGAQLPMARTLTVRFTSIPFINFPGPPLAGAAWLSLLPVSLLLPQALSPRVSLSALSPSLFPPPVFVFVFSSSSVFTKGTESVKTPARGAAAGFRRSAARTHNYKPVSIKQVHGPRRGWSAAP